MIRCISINHLIYMKKIITAAILALLPGFIYSNARAQFTLLSNFSANQPGGFSAGEITAFDNGSGRLFVTSSGSNVHRLNIFNLSNPSAPTEIGVPIDFSTTFGAANNMLSLSSVAVNTAKGFGVATLIPTANTTTLGRIGFFDLATGTNLGSIAVGFHPDSVIFSPDGSKIVVVNEGEFNSSSSTNAPGSISVVDVSSINSSNLLNLITLSPVTRDFSAGNLGTGASLSGIRNHNVAAIGTSGAFIANVPDFTLAANQNFLAIEPEYASISGDKVYVSLQENNAIGVFDLTTEKWTQISSLGTINQLIDATDQNSLGVADNAISISQTVAGLPMPDTVATYTVGGKTYVITANEGDARGDDRDVSRFGSITGNSSLNPIIDTNAPSNFPTNQTGVRALDQLGRLTVSRLDGDTDADGKIDLPTMIGTRSFTIWEDTGTGLVKTYDSGSFFETYIRDFDPLSWVDSRSDDKGPEPEGLALGSFDGKTFAFISMERQAGIFMFDITNPESPSFVDYIRIATGSIPLRPEGMLFVSAADSPNGQNLLIVAYEGDGNSATNERVAVFSVVPEPSTAGLLLALSSFVTIFRRKRLARGNKP